MGPSTYIWPYDVVRNPQPSRRDDLNHIRCFLICPFRPKEVYEDLYSVVAQVCGLVGGQLSCRVECLPADKISSSGVIHAEIWHEIQTADVVIADVSEINGKLNGNVLFELGVASAIRDKQHVIIIKEQSPDQEFLFDLSPARHITYQKTYLGYKEFFRKLFDAITECLTPAPFMPQPELPTPIIPLEADFTKGMDVDWLVGPSITHRRLLPDCLEYGSLYVFRNSWLVVPNLEVGNLELTALMKFTMVRDVEGWIGIGIRSHHFFANYSHLLYVSTMGKIVRTIPQIGLSEPDNDIIGALEGFQPLEAGFLRFHIEADEHHMSMYVGDKGKSSKVADMPYHIPKGKIVFQTYNARAGIQSISIKAN